MFTKLHSNSHYLKHYRCDLEATTLSLNPASLGLISDWANFLVEVFSGVFPQLSDKCQEM